MGNFESFLGDVNEKLGLRFEVYFSYVLGCLERDVSSERDVRFVGNLKI